MSRLVGSASTAEERSGGAGLELCGTADQQLIYLNTHWGRRYAFMPPQAPAGHWTATAKFGGRDQVRAPTAAELLAAVRAHYQASRPENQAPGTHGAAGREC
jgi:hypothetical protein